MKMSILISTCIKDEGVEVDSAQHETLSRVIETTEPDFDENSPQWLLWQQQKGQSLKKGSRGMRWHPLIIRWCLSVYFSSPAAYKQIASKRLGFLKLPHVNTLKQYCKFSTGGPGFNPDILKRLAEESSLPTLKEFQKNVTLIFDEMQIKSNLVYKRSTGKLIGFTAMGDVSEEFRKKFFSKYVKHDVHDTQVASSDSAKKYQRNIATHVIVYMVWGLFTNLCYSFSYFASTGFTSAQLDPCTMEATQVLESLGFLVRALVSDGASPNRKFNDIVSESVDSFYFTQNPFDRRRRIYLISDVPHLLKTTRNCFENSCWNKNTRNLHVCFSVF